MSSKRAISPRNLTTRPRCSPVQAICARREIEAEHVDGGEAPLVGDGAIENDMAVERAADRVGDGIIVVVAVDEDRKNAGDRALALFAGAGALQKPRQVAEDARRIAARDGGLSGGQRDLASAGRSASSNRR